MSRLPFSFKDERFLSGVSAGDVAFEGLNVVLVAGDDPLDEIADRNDADNVVAVDNGQMTKVVVGHEIEAVVDGVARSNGDDGAGHDFAHLSVFGMVAFENAFAGVVALREDADEAATAEDHERADVVFGHEGKGVEDGLVWREGENLVEVFVPEYLVDGVGDFHGALLGIGGVRRRPRFSSGSNGRGTAV